MKTTFRVGIVQRSEFSASQRRHNKPTHTHTRWHMFQHVYFIFSQFYERLLFYFIMEWIFFSQIFSPFVAASENAMRYKIATVAYLHPAQPPFSYGIRPDVWE